MFGIITYKIILLLDNDVQEADLQISNMEVIFDSDIDYTAGASVIVKDPEVILPVQPSKITPKKSK